MNQKRSKVFYGWWIVGACIIISMYFGGVITFGFTAIFEPIAKEFGWSYAQISFAASLRGLEAGLLTPVAGILVDRWGPRGLMLSGVGITGLGLVLLSRTTSLGMFWGAFALIAVGLTAGSNTVMMTTIANWFRRRVGIAAGIALSGWGLAGVLVPLVVKVIDMYDWRTAMLIFGIGMWAIGLPLSLLFRHKPEPYGYLPDGEVNNGVIVDESLTLVRSTGEVGARRILASRAFWHIALSLMCGTLAIMAVITHIMPYLSSIGIPRSTSSLVTSAIPLVSIGGRLSLGWISDRFDKKRLAVASFALLSLSLLLFDSAAIGSRWLLVPSVILFGTGWGAMAIMRVVLTRAYFGRHQYGTAAGFIAGIETLGMVTGPLTAGWVFDNWGSYQGVWFALAGLVVVALVIMATIPPLGAGVQPEEKP